MRVVEIKKCKVWLNDTLFFEKDDAVDFSDFAKSLYKFLAIDYAKFYKMDQQSKLAFLAAEILLKDENTLASDQNIALLFSNTNSSLESDRIHHNAIQDKDDIFPSPAVFVYTLANICLGEVSIRHHLKTESAFFISNEFNEKQLTDYANYLIKNNRSKKVVVAWVDYLLGNYEVKMNLIE